MFTNVSNRCYQNWFVLVFRTLKKSLRQQIVFHLIRSWTRGSRFTAQRAKRWNVKKHLIAVAYGILHFTPIFISAFLRVKWARRDFEQLSGREKRKNVDQRFNEPASNANSHSHCLLFVFSADFSSWVVFLTFDKQWKPIMWWTSYAKHGGGDST